MLHGPFLMSRCASESAFFLQMQPVDLHSLSKSKFPMWCACPKWDETRLADWALSWRHNQSRSTGFQDQLFFPPTHTNQPSSVNQLFRSNFCHMYNHHRHRWKVSVVQMDMWTFHIITGLRISHMCSDVNGGFAESRQTRTVRRKKDQVAPIFIYSCVRVRHREHWRVFSIIIHFELLMYDKSDDFF